MLITICTPTFNRSSYLHRIHRCLEEQTFRDFEWIIVDDGSTDETSMVFEEIRDICTYELKYLRKDNGGKHTAINLGVKVARGELFLILDSDDSLSVNSLKVILEYYNKCKDRDDCAGVCGIMSNHNGKIIGSGFPHDILYENSLSLRYYYRVSGDLLEIFKTSVMKEFPFPEIHGEKFCPEVLVWNRMASKYKLYCFNEVVYFRDYLVGGLTDKIITIRMKSPIASMMTYQEMTLYDIPLLQKMKAATNYWRFRLCTPKKDVPKIKWYWWVCKPLGWLMHVRDLSKTSSNRIK